MYVWKNIFANKYQHAEKIITIDIDYRQSKQVRKIKHMHQFLFI